MSEYGKRVDKKGRGAGKPYQDLYIYLIKGLVTEADEANLGKAYLGNWIEGESSFLFFWLPSGKSVLRVLEDRSDLELVEEYHFTYEEWQGGGLEPFRIEHFLISAPWEDNAGAGQGETKILLDPGVVFGTGLHPTTRDCLRAMVYLQREGPFERVLDLGTGTGILALAAAFLGAGRVLAVDSNPLCVKTARRNVALNHLEGTIRVVEGNAEDLIFQDAELVTANIHHDVMAGLFKNNGFPDKKWLILSGLMRSQARDVKEALKKQRFYLAHEWDHEMTWYTLLARNESHKCQKCLP